MSSVMSSFIRKSLRFYRISSLSSTQIRYLSYFSSSSLPASSSSLISKTKANLDPTKPSSLLPVRFASSSAEKLEANENLKRLLDSGIKCAEDSDDLDKGLPDLSPFEVVDNPGEQAITLKQEIAGRNIEVLVHELAVEKEENDDVESGDEDDQQSKHPQSHVSLIVYYNRGRRWHLEFGCTAYPDEITIDRMEMKRKDLRPDHCYEGRKFSDLDEKVQKAFYKFLEVRVITGSVANSLLEYMVNMENKEYLRWLKKVKSFVSV